MDYELKIKRDELTKLLHNASAKESTTIGKSNGVNKNAITSYMPNKGYLLVLQAAVAKYEKTKYEAMPTPIKFGNANAAIYPNGMFNNLFQIFIRKFAIDFTHKIILNQLRCKARWPLHARDRLLSTMQNRCKRLQGRFIHVHSARATIPAT